MTYLAMHRGDDRTLEVTASEDLTGSELTFTARHRSYSDDIVIQKTSSNGITVNGQTATISIDATDTADLDPDVLYWDIQVVDTAGDTHTVATGRLAIKHDVTYA